MAAVLGLTAFSAVSCGDDDNNSGGGGTTPPTDIVSYKIKYTVKLTDPNIMEAADVLVEYLDTDGRTQKDTVKEAQWTKEVSLMKGKKVNYGLEARLFAKQNPELTKDTYNFDIDISSPMFNVYNNGENYFSANVRSHGHGGILSDNVSNTIVG